MRAYAEFAVKKFRNKTAYRMDCFMGILQTVFSFIVYCSIYKALYGDRTEVDGITFSMVVTNFIISLGLSNAFNFNEMFLPDKVSWGEISNELLKPVSFRLRLLSEHIGESVFKLIFNFIPSLIFAVFTAGLTPPSSALNMILMIISAAMGYLILWELSFIIQTWSFWLFSVWGIIVMKNVLVNILTGSMIPLWFMPSALRKVISFTPFESVYFTPIRLYLGQISGSETAVCMINQVVWIVILFIIGDIFWKKGTKKLVVQGG